MSKLSTGVVVLSLLALLLAPPGDASAQSHSASSRLVGAWMLASWVLTDAGGNESQPYGPDAVGQIVYTDSGRMGVHQMRPNADLPDVSGLGPNEALARMATTFFAYYGTYTVDEIAGPVTHHLEGAMDPTSVGTDQVRQFEFVDNDTLRLTAIVDDPLTREIGASGTNVLIWKRVR